MLKILLWIGGLFFILEGLLHFFGLPILEHDKIFLPTHDRYIAIFAFIVGTLLLLVSNNSQKYKMLLLILLIGIFFLMLNGILINVSGGYSRFNVLRLDQDLSIIGYLSGVWYLLTWIYFFKLK